VSSLITTHQHFVAYNVVADEVPLLLGRGAINSPAIWATST